MCAPNSTRMPQRCFGEVAETQNLLGEYIIPIRGIARPRPKAFRGLLLRHAACLFDSRCRSLCWVDVCGSCRCVAQPLWLLYARPRGAVVIYNSHAMCMCKPWWASRGVLRTAGAVVMCLQGSGSGFGRNLQGRVVHGRPCACVYCCVLVRAQWAAEPAACGLITYVMCRV